MACVCAAAAEAFQKTHLKKRAKSEPSLIRSNRANLEVGTTAFLTTNPWSFSRKKPQALDSIVTHGIGKSAKPFGLRLSENALLQFPLITIRTWLNSHAMDTDVLFTFCHPMHYAG